MKNLTLLERHYALIKELPATKQGMVYKAIFDYAMEYKEPTLLTGLSKAIFDNIRPYIENLEKQYQNGLKGGRPSKDKTKELSQLEETQIDSQSKTQTETQIITQQQTQTESLKDKDYYSLSNKINNLSMRVRAGEREEAIIEVLKENFKDYLYYWGGKEDKEVFNEAISVMSKAMIKAQKGELRFYQMKYSFDMLIEQICKLDEQDIRDITWQVLNNQDIRDRNNYILGALLSRASEKK